MKIPHSGWLLLGLSAALLPGCRAKTLLPGAANTDMVVPPVPMPQSPFQVTARANKSEFAAGEAVELEIEIKNNSEQSADLNFSSGQKFDFSATREGEKQQIWSYGMNKRFMQMLQTVTVEAGKSLEFQTVWKGAKPGKYTISAIITANSGLEAAPFEIVVK